MLSREDLAQLRSCDHRTHQIDEKGIGDHGEHFTSCPDHPTFNQEWAERSEQDRIISAVVRDIRSNGPIRQAIKACL